MLQRKFEEFRLKGKKLRYENPLKLKLKVLL